MTRAAAASAKSGATRIVTRRLSPGARSRTGRGLAGRSLDAAEGSSSATETVASRRSTSASTS
ncbi:MAG TPA: hypothetical protein VM889_09975 [Candidatus Thermoplasmatota archaeon]|nr:hypothetical protein [Candidatus Thermoplasmatota archaeon]